MTKVKKIKEFLQTNYLCNLAPFGIEMNLKSF